VLPEHSWLASYNFPRPDIGKLFVGISGSCVAVCAGGSSPATKQNCSAKHIILNKTLSHMIEAPHGLTQNSAYCQHSQRNVVWFEANN
jgi:hypothetical protein